jgi:hypothetical protein
MTVPALNTYRTEARSNHVLVLRNGVDGLDIVGTLALRITTGIVSQHRDHHFRLHSVWSGGFRESSITTSTTDQHPSNK